MSKTVIISPCSQRLPNNARNPKNYPHWEQVVTKLKDAGVKTIQVGVNGEPSVGADELLLNQPLRNLEKLVSEYSGWVSVDNFFPHMCNVVGKPGVVVWGQSDPTIFGYTNNVNLLKSRDCLRASQWSTWTEATYRDDVWVSPDVVANAVLTLIKD